MTNPIHNHPHEEARLRALRSLQVLDTPIEERFERITRLARGAFHVPICAISCVDRERVWFKSNQGITCTQVDRGDAICQHTVLHNEPLVINDTRFDEQFAGKCKDPRFIFYAGAPIFSEDGLPIAALCVVDNEPRFFDEQDLAMLKDFAKLAERELCRKTSNKIAYELTDQIDESWRQLLLDPITRVWNHEGTMTLVGEAVSNVQFSNKGISLLMIDAKGLETIRDHLGIEPYQEVVTSFSAGLLSIIRENDTLGRIQDHEFVIELAGTDNRKDLRVAIGRINAYLAKYMPHAEITVQLEECGVDWSLDASIAAVLVPAGTTLNANTAMEILDDAIDQAERCPDGIPVILDAQEQIDKATDTDTNRAA